MQRVRSLSEEDVVNPILYILEADRKAPRKQRHTSHRIYERIRVELPGHPVGESTVRRYVGRRKREMGFIRQETFVPQSYAWATRRRSSDRIAASSISGICRCASLIWTPTRRPTGSCTRSRYRWPCGNA